jgi:hypothetical protein
LAATASNILRAREARAGLGPFDLTTRYLPKRHEEIAGGSLYWIVKHQLIARSPILGFGEAENGRVAIRLDPRLILVQARPKRAHQGWRYLEDVDAPVDLDDAGRRCRGPAAGTGGQAGGDGADLIRRIPMPAHCG